jgi:fused signal recognition particle receptor
MENWMLIALVAVVVFFAVAAFVVVRRKRTSIPPAAPEVEKKVEKIPEARPTIKVEPPVVVPRPEPVVEAKPAAVPVAPAPKLADKLSRTRGAFFGKLGKLLQGRSSAAMDAKEWEALEEALLEADVGISTTTQLLGRVKDKLKTAESADIRDLMRHECKRLLDKGGSGLPDLASAERPYVISIVGINGVGKTTTTGKLAYLLKSKGHRVLLGAADTFRAAAIAQLQVWAERADVQIVTGREGADPGAVAFDALTAAKARGVDVVLVDTAGRLHTKTSLMDELKKVTRVMKKVIPTAPHETWLVLDGTLGQNSLQQAKEFQKTLELTGVIITKLDGTAKGGALLAVTSELGLPVRFIGVGEAIEDFIPFDPSNFVDAILGD